MAKIEYTPKQQELIKIARFIQSKGLKEKEAVVGAKQIPYFRCQDFHEIVLQYGDSIEAMMKENTPIKFESFRNQQELAELFIEEKLLATMQRIPDEQKKLKWPKKLLLGREITLQEKGFACWTIKEDSSKNLYYAVGLILGILAIVMYPSWPFELKLGVYYVSFYLLWGLIFLIIIRYIVFVICYILGMHFWIFPNMMDDTRGILKSFVPFYSFEFATNDMLNFFCRGFWLSLTVLIVMYYVYVGTFDVQEIKLMMEDSFDWGKDKIVGNNTALVAQGGSAYDRIEDIMNIQEEEEAALDEEVESPTEDM